MSALQRDRESYRVVSVEEEESKATAVCSKQGGIAQLGCSGTKATEMLVALLAYLSECHANLKVSNIPTTETELIHTLLQNGFTNTVNQYEMMISL